MMKNRILSTFLLLGLAFTSASLNAQIQSTRNPGDTEVSRAPDMIVPLYKTVNVKTEKGEDWSASMKNTMLEFEEGEDMQEEAVREAREHANRLKAERNAAIARGETPPLSLGVAARTDSGAPGIEQQVNWFANKQLDGYPMDHDIAISNGGLIMSTSNTKVYVYDTTGLQRDLSSFSTFYSGSPNTTDPRVVYNPDYDRFIFIFLSGFTHTDNKVVVCFSQTNDPEGAWNVYTLNGNANVAYFGNVWMDYPNMGMSNTDLFISCNPFTDAGVSKGAHIYQVKMADGFGAAASLTVKGWSTNTGFTLCPAQGWTGGYGDNLFFISTRSLAAATTSFRMYEVTGNVDDAGAALIKYDINGDLSYDNAPDVSQMGTTTDLDNGSMRVRSAYYENGQIFFCFSGSTSGVAEIYLGKITGLSTPSFASIHGQYIRIDTVEIGVPSVAYGGYQNAAGDNATLLMFNSGGSTRFPGNGVVMIEPDGTMGVPLILKNGFTYCKQGSTNPERWGDYTDAVQRYNHKQEVWVSGYYGYDPTNHRHGTWISRLQITSPQSVGVEPAAPAEPAIVLYPNPVDESSQLMIHFEVPTTQAYRGRIYDAQGKMVHLVSENRLSQGTAYLTFNTGPLAAGTYTLVITGDNGEIYRDKFVVVK